MSILRTILEAKRRRVDALRRQRPWASLEADPLFAEPRRSLADALRRGEGPVRFLCEIKRASPSAGPIRLDADAVRIAREYRESGAAAISLVTEEAFFGGRPEDLPVVRGEGLPVLMKDFMVDPWQVAWGRAIGADAILLIAAVNDRPLLREVRAAARELGLDTLVEVHAEIEVEDAVRLEPELVGVNHRDLRTFEVDLGLGERILPFLPPAVRLAESGIRTRADVERLQRAGFDGLLVGESLMRADSPGRALRVLRGAEGPDADGGDRRASDSDDGKAFDSDDREAFLDMDGAGGGREGRDRRREDR